MPESPANFVPCEGSDSFPVEIAGVQIVDLRKQSYSVQELERTLGDPEYRFHLISNGRIVEHFYTSKFNEAQEHGKAMVDSDGPNADTQAKIYGDDGDLVWEYPEVPAPVLV